MVWFNLFTCTTSSRESGEVIES